MSDKAAKVMKRYQMGYVTDSQLVRYLELGAITQAEYDTIYALRHPPANAEGKEDLYASDL